jgi:hypothetical protein
MQEELRRDQGERDKEKIFQLLYDLGKNQRVKCVYSWVCVCV